MGKSNDDQQGSFFGAVPDAGTISGKGWKLTSNGLLNASGTVTGRVQTHPWDPREYHDDHKYEAWLPDWTQLSNLQQELGDSFEVLAPTMYNRWKECKAIIDFRKANDLLGG